MISKASKLVSNGRLAFFLIIAAAGVVAAILLLRSHRRATQPEAVPDHWEAVAQGRAFLDQGRPDKAFEAVSGIRDELAGAGEAMTIAGLALIQYREYRGARMTLERALRLEPAQLDATKALASINLMLGNGGRGVQLLEAAAALDPGDAQVWLKMGKVYHDLGDTSKACESFAEALGLSPGDRDALLGLSTELLNSNRAIDAGPRLSEALRRFPDSADFLGLAARQARETGRGEEAAELASRTLRIDPDNLNALLVLTRERVAAGHPEQALDDLRRAVASHPNDLASLQLLAQVEARLGMTEQSRATSEKHRNATERARLIDGLTKEIAGRPDDPDLRVKLGQLAAEGGSLLLASQCFQAALALDPGHAPAREKLAEIQAAAPPASTTPVAGGAGKPGAGPGPDSSKRR